MSAPKTKVAREVDALLAAHEGDEVLASPGSFSYEEAMDALEKKHAGVPRDGLDTPPLFLS